MPRETGIYQQIGTLEYFIPHALPPKNPDLILTPEIMRLYGEASFSLGQLNEMTQRFPNPERFIKAYAIKEALLSSAIEGIHTTMTDVFTHGDSNQSDINRNKETQLVLNYTKSLERALVMLERDNIPLSSRIILATHEALMHTGANSSSSPGQYRKQAVKVGSLTPPPAPEINRLMGELEIFMNSTEGLPPLIKAGLAHVQFETIHPFLDGNGRVGRVLIVLMLISNKLLHSPLLYPSYYLKKHQLEYYTRLNAVRTDGDFEGWIAYYLTAIRESALDAHHRAKAIEALEHEIKENIMDEQSFARARETALKALSILFYSPVISTTDLSTQLGKSYNTTQSIINQFLTYGVISEVTEQKRNKLYRFDGYLELLEQE